MNRARVDEAINRRVTIEEVRHALERDIPPGEGEEVLELVRWFTSRYPTAEQRLGLTFDWRSPPRLGRCIAIGISIRSGDFLHLSVIHPR